MKIYHNPRCSKSREALNFLIDKGIEPEVCLYMENTPGETELKELLAKLNMKAEELLRKNEQVYKDQFKGKNLSEEDWIKAMVAHPKLIQRPIVLSGKKAVVARPAEKLEELI